MGEESHRAVDDENTRSNNRTAFGRCDGLGMDAVDLELSHVRLSVDPHNARAVRFAGRVHHRDGQGPRHKLGARQDPIGRPVDESGTLRCAGPKRGDAHGQNRRLDQLHDLRGSERGRTVGAKPDQSHGADDRCNQKRNQGDTDQSSCPSQSGAHNCECVAHRGPGQGLVWLPGAVLHREEPEPGP